MNILVLGNGFDLAHGLKTKYKDFLDYTDELVVAIPGRYNYINNLGSDPKNNIKDYFGDLMKKYGTNPEIRNRIDEQCKLIENNKWICHFKNVSIREGWVDFEREISRVIKIVDEARIKIDESNRGGSNTPVSVEPYQQKTLNIFAETLESFSPKDIEQIKEIMLTDLNRLTRCLELYFDGYIDHLEIVQKIDCINALQIDRVISFNYTRTYEKIYGNAKIQYDYIHGRAGIGSDLESCNLVLGIDEYLDEQRRNADNAFVEFKKFYQRIFKKTGCEYRKWLGNFNHANAMTPKASPAKMNIYFYGHSLDVTDKDIIAKLIRQKNATTTIFYHSRSALSSQICNLVKVIGEEELIERTGANNPTIIFVFAENK